MRRAWWLLVLAGCPGGESDAPVDTEVADTDDGARDFLEFEEVVTITDLATDDLTCLPAVGTWNASVADPSCVVERPLTGDIEDFESGDPVPYATVEFFFDDVVDDTPDATVVATVDGKVEGIDGFTCQTFASRATTTDGETLPAIQMHWSEPFGETVDTFFNSVATSTLDLMQAVAGVQPVAGHGVLAGTVYHCGGEGEPMANVQVVARNAEGRYPAVQAIRYFVSEFPSTLQAQTSEDGLWLIANLPPGDYVVEAWAVVEAGAAPRLIAQTEMIAFADSLTVADVYTGSGDGKVLPPDCLTPCLVF